MLQSKSYLFNKKIKIRKTIKTITEYTKNLFNICLDISIYSLYKVYKEFTTIFILDFNFGIVEYHLGEIFNFTLEISGYFNLISKFLISNLNNFPP